MYNVRVVNHSGRTVFTGRVETEELKPFARVMTRAGMTVFVYQGEGKLVTTYIAKA